MRLPNNKLEDFRLNQNCITSLLAKTETDSLDYGEL